VWWDRETSWPGVARGDAPPSAERPRCRGSDSGAGWAAGDAQHPAFLAGAALFPPCRALWPQTSQRGLRTRRPLVRARSQRALKSGARHSLRRKGVSNASKSPCAGRPWPLFTGGVGSRRRPRQPSGGRERRWQGERGGRGGRASVPGRAEDAHGATGSRRGRGWGRQAAGGRRGAAAEGSGRAGNAAGRRGAPHHRARGGLGGGQGLPQRHPRAGLLGGHLLRGAHGLGRRTGYQPGQLRDGLYRPHGHAGHGHGSGHRPQPGHHGPAGPGRRPTLPGRQERDAPTPGTTRGDGKPGQPGLPGRRDAGSGHWPGAGPGGQHRLLREAS
jgi:hypothetical protein